MNRNRKQSHCVYHFASSIPLSASSIGFVAGEFSEQIASNGITVMGAIGHSHSYKLHYSILWSLVILMV